MVFDCAGRLYAKAWVNGKPGWLYNPVSSV